MIVCFRSFRDQLAEVLLPFFIKQCQFVPCSDATWQLQVHVSSLPSGLVLAELFLVKMSLQKDAFAATVLVSILADTDFIRFGLTCEEIHWLQSGVVSPGSNSAVFSSERAKNMSGPPTQRTSWENVFTGAGRWSALWRAVDSTVPQITEETVKVVPLGS